jgi:hypothetical protein
MEVTFTIKGLTLAAIKGSTITGSSSGGSTGGAGGGSAAAAAAAAVEAALAAGDVAAALAADPSLGSPLGVNNIVRSRLEALVLCSTVSGAESLAGLTGAWLVLLADTAGGTALGAGAPAAAGNATAAAAALGLAADPLCGEGAAEVVTFRIVPVITPPT